MRFNKILLILLSLVFNNFILAQQAPEDKIKEVISLFFDGLHHGDTLKIKQAISEELILQTIFVNKEGETILRNENVRTFLNSVGSKNKDDQWEEKLLSFKIRIDDKMANVWTPYEFYLNENFNHCGVNSFQMFQKGKDWKIIYLKKVRIGRLFI